MTTFGLWLKRARRARDLTQEMLAEQVGCATPTLQKIEQGARRPSRELAELLLDALGAPLADRDAILRAARAPVGVETAVPAEPAPPAPPRARIPAPASPLVGRDAERADLRRILADPSCRLLTIVGPGGIGKTRMALQAVADLLDPLAPAAGLADGAAWVSLAPLTSTDQAPAAIAAALDIPLYGALAPDAQLVAAMRERQMLLALDNLEHLPDIAVLLASILGEAPGVRLLTTSRERLRLRDEQVYELGGLAFPAEGGAPAAGRHTAVQLFLERARRLDQGFALGVDNAADIARICRALAGVPLAIELAAAWVRALSCAEIADSLARDLDFLSLSDRDMAPRHRSLRAVFAHSWHALGPPERAALARLSVFRGGCRAAAAAQVAEASPRTLAALVDASLVRRSQDAGGASRYDLHELLRQYAAERLGEQDPQGETERAHRAYYAELLQAQVQDLQSGGQIAARAAIDPDRNNVRAAWERAVAARDLPVLRQMARGIATVCEDNGWFQEGARLFGQAADALDSAGLAPELLASSTLSTRAPAPARPKGEMIAGGDAAAKVSALVDKLLENQVI
ncbi:helix-turn-helix domain-containing protein [Oscillochloris sp. ZM17-4]|uniref:ATP-binding protein n=1 Tax=Oscillochloris sp. ZM17-4 TaxID=2866714 RepID=UPI001C72A296|nr:helix-turn-helix domain-containing protein [Oscillochloris sp. ZM17-4]MBX0328929.1 helix-turn-helix domain-containing protein [Oscillochloris sp. ZM17-4]